MSVLYLHLTYEHYKAFQQQCLAFAETTHKTEGGFYHKSLRMIVDDTLIIEFHGPLVGGEEHLRERTAIVPDFRLMPHNGGQLFDASMQERWEAFIAEEGKRHAEGLVESATAIKLRSWDIIDRRLMGRAWEPDGEFVGVNLKSVDFSTSTAIAENGVVYRLVDRASAANGNR